MPTRPIGPADSAERAFGDDDPALTDEERIVRLLASNGGRMKQSQIVDRTDWSKAKVSRLLSSMEDGEEITKLTVGRENIIFLGSMDGVYASDDGPRD
ncbi:helix-turn-helix domain-containing protein [Halalkalicoccus sp. NIPERK01]|nr:helix-turn-helix domain-containing protein [Halalkalicoccus sp. NIPERK01]